MKSKGGEGKKGLSGDGFGGSGGFQGGNADRNWRIDGDNIALSDLYKRKGKNWSKDKQSTDLIVNKGGWLGKK